MTTTEKGALTQVYLSTDPQIDDKDISGKFFVPVAKEEVLNKYAMDANLAKELWMWTSKIVVEKLGDKVTIFE